MLRQLVNRVPAAHKSGDFLSSSDRLDILAFVNGTFYEIYSFRVEREVDRIFRSAGPERH